MRFLLRFAGAVIVAFALVWTGPAAAASSSPAGSATGAGDSADKEVSDKVAAQKMLQLNEEGFEAFSREDFVEAARNFEKAHGWVPDPILRKNAAIAWFKGGQCPEATRAALFFLLAEDTLRQDRLEARSVLAHCRLGSAERALERGNLERAVQIVAWVAVLEADERVAERLKALEMRLADEIARGAGHNQAQVNMGWGLIGVGAAILVSTAAYQSTRTQRAAEADSQSWVFPTLYGAGTLSLGGGVWLLYAGSRESDGPESTKPAALRAPAPDFEVGWAVQF